MVADTHEPREKVGKGDLVYCYPYDKCDHFIKTVDSIPSDVLKRALKEIIQEGINNIQADIFSKLIQKWGKEVQTRNKD